MLFDKFYSKDTLKIFIPQFLLEAESHFVMTRLLQVSLANLRNFFNFESPRIWYF